MASTANPQVESLTLHERAIFDATDTEAYRAGIQRDKFQMSEGAEFLWATLEPDLLGEASASSISSTASCHGVQTSNDIEYGDEHQFLGEILREAGLLESSSKERQREHRCPAEAKGLSIPIHGMSGFQPISRNASRCNGKEDTRTEAPCLEHESFVVDTTRKQCCPSNPRKFRGVRCPEDATAASISSSHYCGVSHGISCQTCSSHCLMISVRRRGEMQQVEVSQPITMLLPQSPSERAAIGANIWTAFEVLKERNERERDLAIRTRQGRPLREVAPIPWLKWRTKGGRFGQFRSKQNFETWWSSNVVLNGKDPGTGIAWLMVQL